LQKPRLTTRSIFAACSSTCRSAAADHVYVSWDALRGQVDDIAFADLARYFAWIWYPASDDIQIFDESFSWLLVIGHEGDVSLARLTA
jgi:hypothetical protein